MDTLNTFNADIRRLDNALENRPPSHEAEQGRSNFASVLDSVQGPSAEPARHYTVRSGDNLSAIAQNMARQRGLDVSSAESYRLALELAARNDIRNPNRIQPGQQLELDRLHTTLNDSGRWRPLSPANTAPPLSASAAPPSNLNSTQNWLDRRSPWQTSTPNLPPASPSTSTPIDRTSRDHPVLKQTLERAVARGFIPAQEKQAVQSKILQLAEKYRFSPDDFARMTLMESDGMNPRASNQRCHGIIQFCDGPNRGAAAVGYGQQPRAILGLSVYQQLHLVDHYFQNNGLGKNGPTRLDDLYLTVLQPAARQEKQAHAPLNIPGQQARDLHVGASTQQAITRQSIVQGLFKITQEKLSSIFSPALSGKTEPMQIVQGSGPRQNSTH